MVNFFINFMIKSFYYFNFKEINTFMIKTFYYFNFKEINTFMI